MSSNLVRAASAVVLALVMASPAMATEREQPPAEGQSSTLKTMRVDEITGTKVVNDKGDEVGEVESIVRDRTKNELFAVVSVGGFLGIGDHDVTIALEDLSLQGDRLVLPAGTTKEQLERMPEYREASFDELPDEERVSIGQRTGAGPRER